MHYKFQAHIGPVSMIMTFVYNFQKNNSGPHPTTDLSSTYISRLVKTSKAQRLQGFKQVTDETKGVSMEEIEIPEVFDWNLSSHLSPVYEVEEESASGY